MPKLSGASIVAVFVCVTSLIVIVSGCGGTPKAGTLTSTTGGTATGTNTGGTNTGGTATGGGVPGPTLKHGTFTLIKPLNPGDTITIVAISSNDHLLGYSSPAGSPKTHPAYWETPASNPVPLSGNQPQVSGVNAGGQVVGWDLVPYTNGSQNYNTVVPVEWNSALSGYSQLDTSPITTPPQGGGPQAQAINDNGEIVGNLTGAMPCYWGSGSSKVVVLDPGKDIATPFFFTLYISNLGLIVGDREDLNSPARDVVSWAAPTASLTQFTASGLNPVFVVQKVSPKGNILAYYNITGTPKKEMLISGVTQAPTPILDGSGNILSITSVNDTGLAVGYAGSKGIQWKDAIELPLYYDADLPATATGFMPLWCLNSGKIVGNLTVSGSSVAAFFTPNP